MGKRGPKPKPLAVLKLEGAYRGYLPKRGPVTGGDALRKPDDLQPDASDMWDHVTRTRGPWLCSSDAASLAALCESWAFLRECSRRLEADPTDRDTRVAWAAYAGFFTKMAAAFGLTPGDRASLGEDKAERDADAELEGMLS
ncbi:hypothetical protein [Botrimarina sp.]|uniref:hypothetical protein n=1 Tax=Botrimarina sp. TaxID=2795802 RepID=UPI0032ED9B4E